MLGWRVWDSPNKAIVEHRESGARATVYGNRPEGLHGARAALVLADEPAQWGTVAERSYAALSTSLGKVAGSKLVAFGTAPASSGGWFARLLAGKDSIVYRAPEGADPFHVDTWRRANPSLDHMPALRQAIEREAAAARQDGSLMLTFRALRLNQGVSDTAQAWLLDPGTWEGIEGEAAPDGPVVWGVDVGGAAAMSAVCAYWVRTGRLACLACFPRDPGLAERGLRDGVGDRYLKCAAEGTLINHGRESARLPGSGCRGVAPVGAAGVHIR